MRKQVRCWAWCLAPSGKSRAGCCSLTLYLANGYWAPLCARDSDQQWAQGKEQDRHCPGFWSSEAPGITGAKTAPEPGKQQAGTRMRQPRSGWGAEEAGGRAGPPCCRSRPKPDALPPPWRSLVPGHGPLLHPPSPQPSLHGQWCGFQHWEAGWLQARPCTP